jgi:signal transduction histidine kinase
LPRKFFKTLRFRLTVWNTIVVLVASLLALLTVREAMRLTIEDEASELLRDEVLELELAIAQLSPDQDRIHQEFERKILGHSQHGWFAAMIDTDGTFLWRSEGFPDDWASGAYDSDAVDFQKSADWLLVQRRIPAGKVPGSLIVLGEPTEFIQNDVWQLTKIMLYIGAALVLVAPIGGYLLARRATAPVREIISTTRSLNPSRLESRLPIRGTGDELDQISMEINSFVDQISKYIRSQREFVANAAHELRSPITAIQTSVDVTLNNQRSIAEYQDELETVSEQCQQLRYLVNQLLELAETDAVQPNSFEPVDLSELIEKSINVFTGVAEDREIRMDAQLEPAVIVQGNASRLRQVTNNLLDNALKFSPPSSQVKICLSRSESEVMLSVTDSGPGVPDKYLQKIFERFFQMDQARQRDAQRGNGLGLSICKSIVEQHGGQIVAVNVHNGLSLQVRIPLTTVP